MYNSTEHKSQNLTGTITCRELNNGLKIYLRETPEVPIVSVQAWVKTGSIHEDDYLGYGLSHFLEHMMFQGSARYPGNAAADMVHELGGEINAYTSYGHTVYHIDGPDSITETAVDILAGMLRHPEFPPKKFFDEKEVILRERDMVRDNPGRVISEKLWQNIFKVHPVRHPIIGYHEKIEEVDRDIMLDYYRKRYSPLRTFWVISGKIDPDEVIASIEEKLGDWKLGLIKELSLPEEPVQACARYTECGFRDPLVRMSMGFRIPDASHPDVQSLDLLALILGQHDSSRLIQQLKNRKQLAININSFSYTPYFCGIFGVSALCQPQKQEELQKNIRKELDKICDSRISGRELERAKIQLKTDFIRAFRTNSGSARIIGNAILSYNSVDYIEHYLLNLEKVSTEKLRESASKYLAEENSTTVVMTPQNDVAIKKINRPKEVQENKPELKMLSSGQRIISYSDHTLPLVDISLILPGGTISETADNSGISRLTCSMLTAGTEAYKEKELAEILDDNAIDLSISSGNNTMVLKLNCHQDKLGKTLDCLESILKEPAFPKKQFAREKANAIDNLKSRALSPQNAAEDKLCQELYRKHPYSRPSVGMVESVEKIDVGDLKDFFFNRCMVADKAVFGIAGAIDKTSLKKLEKLIDNCKWQRSSVQKLKRPMFPEEASDYTVTVPREQAVVMMGLPTCDNHSQDRFALDVLQTATNGQASDLFKSIRENEGLAYYTGLFASRGLHEGFLAFYAGTSPDKAQQVVSLLEKERKKLCSKALRKPVFEAAVKNALYSLAEQKQNPGSLIFNSALSEFYGNGYLSTWEREKILKDLSLKDTNRIIKKYLNTNSIVTVIAGP
jgi:zinc protease